MALLQIQLNEQKSERADKAARRSGKSPVELVNHAVEIYLAEFEDDASSSDWKTEIMQAAGLWKDRDDLPDIRNTSQ